MPSILKLLESACVPLVTQPVKNKKSINVVKVSIFFINNYIVSKSDHCKSFKDELLLLLIQ
jgi:hypothetical protein